MKWILLLLLLVPFVSANDDIYLSSELLMRQSIANDINIQTDNGAQLNWLSVGLSFVPQQSYRQTLVEERFTPDIYARDDESITFRWTKPARNVDFSYTFDIQTRNAFNPVRDKVVYPIAAKDIPNEVAPYLSHTELIDFTPEIRSKAIEIAGDSDDLFEISVNIAHWITQNIEYDLSTLTAEAQQKASWVYQTQTGVCDELSVLYASMMRSLGVPVRIVSGISYTNSELFTQEWNAHAWVEVYFPKYGWVPFDLTYKQFGFIDASHITLKHSADASDISTRYNWEGTRIDDIDIDLKELDFSTTILESTGKIDPFFDLEMVPVEEDIGFNSYTGIKLIATNTKSHYVAGILRLAYPQELEVETPEVLILLEPFETKEYLVYAKTPQGDPSFWFEYPMSAHFYFAEYAQTSLFVQSNYQVFEKEEIQTRTTLTQQSDLDIRCTIAEDVVFVNQTFTLTCESQTPYDVCFQSRCQSVNPSAVFTHMYNTPGYKEEILTIRNAESERKTKIETHVKDTAKITIGDVRAPQFVEYNQEFNISVLLYKESIANPKKVIVAIGRKNPTIWKLYTVTTHQNVTLAMNANNLAPDENSVNIVIEYEDDSGKRHRITENTVVSVVNLTFWQRVWLQFLDIFR